MKFLFPGKKNENDKTAFKFLLKLLILLSLLKCIFFYYNYTIGDGWHILNLHNFFLLFLWSVLYDLLFIAIINLPLFFLLPVIRILPAKKIWINGIIFLFALANGFLLLLNSVDIFYYRFHRQRADADFLYTLKNPFNNYDWFAVLTGILILLFFSATVFLLFKTIKKIIQNGIIKPPVITPFFSFIFLIIFFTTGKNKLIPNYPLINLSAAQLPLVQNSLHTFIYSLYRKNESMVYGNKYMSDEMMRSDFSIYKQPDTTSSSKRNIVLFIMESIPADFFDSNSNYKVAMPFLDSLVNKSTYFSNAYSFGHHSNQGITSILSGIPTMTDIPLYHSNFINIPVTKIGHRLHADGYETSFFIGDHYDDFGFAQYCNWVGLKYYSMEAIPGYNKMEKHAMGLHDSYVLNFMQQKTDSMQQPFFAVNYNTSTHFPNELPKNYIEKFPKINLSAQMKSMNYYNECLEDFFKNARLQPWFKNTVFIFCADHWMFPDFDNPSYNVLQEFHIPLFIYDPENEQKKESTNLVSQFDILNSILFYAGDKNKFISYGNNLLKSKNTQVAFCRESNIIYQAIDSSYVLGFNLFTGKPEYCFNYKLDKKLKTNLVPYQNNPAIDSLLIKMKAFLQTSTEHYRNKIALPN